MKVLWVLKLKVNVNIQQAKKLHVLRFTIYVGIANTSLKSLNYPQVEPFVKREVECMKMTDDSAKWWGWNKMPFLTSNRGKEEPGSRAITNNTLFLLSKRVVWLFFWHISGWHNCQMTWGLLQVTLSCPFLRWKAKVNSLAHGRLHSWRVFHHDVNLVTWSWDELKPHGIPSVLL